MLNFENIDNQVNFLSKQLNASYDYFQNIQSIIVCGNGSNGYNKNSANFIDSHNLTVRINNYETIGDITGYKKDILFAGASTAKHLSPAQFYPEISNFETIISRNIIIERIKSYKKIQLKHKVILYPINSILNSLKNLGYKGKTGISGLHCSILILAVSKKFNIPVTSFIGFNTYEKNKEKEIYYYGERKILCGHLEQHDWNFHSQFFQIIYDHFPSNV